MVSISPKPAACRASSATPLTSYTSRRSRVACQARGARWPVMATASQSSSWAGRSPSPSRWGAKVWPISKARTSGIWCVPLRATISSSPGASEGRSTDRSEEMGFWSAMNFSGVSHPMALSRAGSTRAYVMAWDTPAEEGARDRASEGQRGGLRHGLPHPTAGQGGGNLVVAPDADDLLDQIVLLGDVAAEARDHNLQREPGVVHRKAQGLKDAHHLLVRRTHADDPLHARASQREAGARLRPRIHIDHALGHGAPAQVRHELRGAIQRLAQPFDVGAALEAIGGVRVEPERAGRSADGAGIEVRALQQHVGGADRHLRTRSAHHPAYRDGTVRVADQEHVGSEGTVLPIEGDDVLAGLRPSHDDPVADDGIVVEGVERVTHLP